MVDTDGSGCRMVDTDGSRCSRWWIQMVQDVVEIQMVQD